MRRNHSILKLHKFGFNFEPRQTFLINGSVRVGDVVMVQEYKQKDFANESELSNAISH